MYSRLRPIALRPATSTTRRRSGSVIERYSPAWPLTTIRSIPSPSIAVDQGGEGVLVDGAPSSVKGVTVTPKMPLHALRSATVPSAAGG